MTSEDLDRADASRPLDEVMPETESRIKANEALTACVDRCMSSIYYLVPRESSVVLQV